MPDYSKGQIYMLECDGLIYVGSTIQTLEKRFEAHIDFYRAYQKDNTKQYCSSYKIFSKNNPVNVILLLEYPCNSKKELLELEQYYIDEIDCINYKKAFRTEEELKEYKNQYQKIYQKTEKSKEYRNNWMKQYRLNKKVKNIN